MALEQKDLHGEEKKAFQDMLPPDDFEPEWKKQFKLMDRHTSNRRRAEHLSYLVLGFALAAFVPGLYEVKIAMIVVLTLWIAACIATAIRSHLAAREIDKKLDEDVRIEKDSVAEAKGA
jgi:uncharacterized membrane protein